MKMKTIFIMVGIGVVIVAIASSILVAKVMGPVWGYVVMPIASFGAIALAIGIFFLMRAIEKRLGIWK